MLHNDSEIALVPSLKYVLSAFTRKNYIIIFKLSILLFVDIPNIL